MKICIVKETLCIGGTERSAANISVALSKVYNVDMVLYDGSHLEYNYGGTLFDMHSPTRNSKIGKVLSHIHRMLYFIWYLRKEKPDFVYVFVYYKHPIFKMRMKNTIKLISARDFGALSMNLDKYKKSLNASDGLICNSEYMKEYYLENYPEDRNKVFSICNLIDIYEIRSKAEKRIEDEQFRCFRETHSTCIISVGRFCSEKAFEHLISAFYMCYKENPNIGLVLVGDGEYKTEYIKLIQSYNINKDVYFTGFQSNPYKYMKQSDIFVLSSYSEGFPNVLVEALALSMPVISVNCYSGPAEILLEKADYNLAKQTYVEANYGVLTPHYDSVGTDKAIEEMAKAIECLLEHVDIKEKYERKAFEGAKRFYSDKAMIKFDNLFFQLKENKNNRKDETNEYNLRINNQERN